MGTFSVTDQCIALKISASDIITEFHVEVHHESKDVAFQIGHENFEMVPITLQHSAIHHFRNRGALRQG